VNTLAGQSDATGYGRAGKYVTQPGGYKAFIPKALPPEPPLVTDSEMQALLSRADAALARLDSSIQTLPNPDRFVYMYVRKEAVLSSQIEGTQSSLDDLLRSEAKVHSPDAPKDVNEISKYISAMNHGLGRLKDLPVSVRLVREIHERLLAGVLGSGRQPGELRRTQNWIGPDGTTLGEAAFVPPPPEVVPDALADLERFIHSDQQMPSLIRVGLAHAQFETIHLFLDGNGRVGRLLITFLLCQRGVLLKPVLYLSYHFKKHRTEYYERLQRIRDDGDWEGWIKFFLECVAAVSEEATATAREIVQLRETHRRVILEHFSRKAGNALRVLEALYTRPMVTVNGVATLIHTSYPAASALVDKMVEHALLREVTGRRRNRVFRYESYVKLFSDKT
jgi:Fic family protein